MSRLRRQIEQDKPFVSFSEEVFLNLVRTADRLSAAETAVLKPSGSSRPQYNVLRILRGAGPKGHPCSEITARMITRVPDVTRLVDRLVEAGLAERERAEDDRRVVQVRIRAAGRDLLAQLDEAVVAMTLRLFAPLSHHDQRALNRLLERLQGDS